MDNETILKLIGAGYTKADIDKMESKPAEESAGTSDSAAGTEGAGSATEEGKEEKEEVSGTDAAIKALTDTVNQLTQTVKAMQAANIQGAQGGKAENKTINDVMNSFIDTL